MRRVEFPIPSFVCALLLFDLASYQTSTLLLVGDLVGGTAWLLVALADLREWHELRRQRARLKRWLG